MMTPEAQRIAIAEACGWKIPDHCKTKRMLAGESAFKARGAPPDFGQDAAGQWHANLPDYLSDLNAMHDAEKVLTQQQHRDYVARLHHDMQMTNRRHPMDHLGVDFDVMHATAAQRAEAFCRTLWPKRFA